MRLIIILEKILEKLLLKMVNIGKNIREVIAKNGGTMPECLPTPKKSLKELEKERKYQDKLINLY